MSTNVNDAVTAWNVERDAAVNDVVTLEANLKTAYNVYVDAMVAYTTRIKTANDMRSKYARTLGIEDISNDTKTRDQFLYAAKPPIENNGPQYMLDRSAQSALTKAATLVAACDSAKLLSRKA